MPEIAAPPAARRQRADARLALSVQRVGGRTRVAGLHESGSARLRLPNHHGAGLEAVTINTGGGITGGDRFATEIAVGEGASLLVTSAAAEKIYRAESEAAVIRNRLVLAAGARLDWIPQETILFDRARLTRRLEVECDPAASALIFEAIVFGRAASDERVHQGMLADHWRVRRGGRLVYADSLRLDGPIADLLARPAIAGGGRAFATLLHVAPDAEARLEEARRHLEGAASECGASAWDGMLAIRWLSADIDTLRRDAARFMTGFRGLPMPRMWVL